MEQDQATEGPEAVCTTCRRIPVSHLAFDVAEPVEGWSQFFEKKGILVLADAAGRPSVARHVLAGLIDEQREREKRLAEEAAAKAAMREEPVPVGIPALEGSTAYETMMSVASTSVVEEFGQRPRPNFLEEALEQGSRQQAAEREAVRRRKEAK